MTRTPFAETHSRYFEILDPPVVAARVSGNVEGLLSVRLARSTPRPQTGEFDGELGRQIFVKIRFPLGDSPLAGRIFEGRWRLPPGDAFGWPSAGEELPILAVFQRTRLCKSAARFVRIERATSSGVLS